MKLHHVFHARAIATNWTGEASDKLEYIGQGFFPPQKKAGLDLGWIKGHKGLPVSLAPSKFDTKSTLRDRVGISLSKTKMAFFRESMLVTEEDEQEILRVQDSNDPYAIQILDNIFNDARTLIDGAIVVPERMCMQLLSPLEGHMGIEIVANNTNYTYNYDPDGSWAAAHFSKITSETDMWNAPATCDPIDDLETALSAQEDAGGNRPEVLIMSKATFNMIKNSAKVQNYILAQNTTATVYLTNSLTRQYLEELLDVRIVIYSKKFKDEAGNAHNFYPDNIVFMCPNASLGKRSHRSLVQTFHS